jgi:hypothetical protein
MSLLESPVGFSDDNALAVLCIQTLEGPTKLPASSSVFEDSRNRFQPPGGAAPRAVGPMIQGGGNAAQGCPFASEPVDFHERGLLARVHFQMLAIGSES